MIYYVKLIPSGEFVSDTHEFVEIIEVNSFLQKAYFIDDNKIAFKNRESASFFINYIAVKKNMQYEDFLIVPKQHLALETVVRVLSNQGPMDFADEDIQPHLTDISKKYGDYRSQMAFTDAAMLSRLDWLLQFIKSNRGDILKDLDYEKH